MNEAAAERLGFDPAEAAVGETILWLHERRLGYEEDRQVPREVVGVMKDFHFRSLHEPIEPLMLFPDREGGHAMIKIDSGNLMEAIAFIEETWNEVNPDFAFEYFFVEDTFARLYEAEQRFGRIFVSFAALAVVIACLGLFGLSSFTAERRTKEIGVRKVLGATIPNLFGMLSSEFVRLVIVANVLAWPVAYAADEQLAGRLRLPRRTGLDDLHPRRRPRHGDRPAHRGFPGRAGGHRQSGRVPADRVDQIARP